MQTIELQPRCFVTASASKQCGLSAITPLVTGEKGFASPPSAFPSNMAMHQNEQQAGMSG